MDRYAVNERTIGEVVNGGGLLVVAQWEAREGQADRIADILSRFLPEAQSEPGAKAVPDFQSKGKSRAVPVLRTVSRRSRFQGASGERAFQDLYRRRSVAAARQTRTRAIRVALRSATAKGPMIGPFATAVAVFDRAVKTAEARERRACRRGRARGRVRHSGAGLEIPCRG